MARPLTFDELRARVCAATVIAGLKAYNVREVRDVAEGDRTLAFCVVPKGWREPHLRRAEVRILYDDDHAGLAERTGRELDEHGQELEIEIEVAYVILDELTRGPLEVLTALERLAGAINDVLGGERRPLVYEVTKANPRVLDDTITRAKIEDLHVTSVLADEFSARWLDGVAAALEAVGPVKRARGAKAGPPDYARAERVPSFAQTRAARTVTSKVPWRGVVRSVQPRIRLTRSFDERSHEYLGYVLGLHGTVGDETRDFLVAVGDGAHEKHRFQVGNEVSGESERVADPQTEVAEFYKASKLVVHARPEAPDVEEPWREPPPYLGLAPSLDTYRARGHRRLAPKTYESKCSTCMWGARMAVVLIVDHWNPGKKRYRVETFCYGPKSCPFYKPGPPRKVPGRKGSSYTEEDWVDEEATGHRGPED